VRGHVREVEPGIWRVWIENGRDPLTGRRRRVTKTIHATSKKQVEEEASRIVLAVRDETVPTTAATTVGHLIDAWLAHAEPNLGPWTIRGYRSKVENHIRPALGDLKLAQLTTARLDRFYRDLLKHGNANTGGALSPMSIRHVHAIIHRACEQARRWGWLDRNPSELAEPPSVDQQQADLPTIADILRVGLHLTADMVQLVWVAIITGARRGELCGLRWSDLDLDAGQLTIARSIADTPDKIIVKATKTGKVRRLAIDATTVELLRARHAGQVAKARTCKMQMDPAGYVFSDSPGAVAPLRPALVTKRWANAARAAKVKCRFHDLRHVMISELLEAGFEIGGVGGRAGHASKVMTLDRYGHSRGAHDLAASEHMAALLAPK
jgi:integrase